MDNALIVRPQAIEALPQITPENMQKALAIGDISQMSDEMRVQYYVATCESMGLNPMTAPFDVIKTDAGKMVLYPNMRCAEQLRMKYGVSTRVISRERVDGLYIVTVQASTRDGRVDEAIGAVPLEKEQGEWKTSQNGRRYFAAEKDAQGNPIMSRLIGNDLANAMKKAESQAKRRATLSICGLGYVNEQAAMAKDARVDFDAVTGEIFQDAPVPLLDRPSEQGKGLAEHVADLFGEPASAMSTILQENINTCLVGLGKSPEDIRVWWEALRQKYPDLTPAVLSMAKERLMERLLQADFPEPGTEEEGPF